VIQGDGVDRSSAEHAALAEEMLAIIDRALRQLSPLCQRIFHLSRVEALSQAAIAEALGISRRTVEDNLRRALDPLRPPLQVPQRLTYRPRQADLRVLFWLFFTLVIPHRCISCNPPNPPHASAVRRCR